MAFAKLPTTDLDVNNDPAALEAQVETEQPSVLVASFQNSKHPVALASHVVFKLGSLFFYLFGALFFTDSFILIFVGVVILLAADFWATKNVTGRLLVGLRWRNEIDREGNSVWHYDAVKDRSGVLSSDSRVFWAFLFGFPFIWMIIFTYDILTLHFTYLPVIFIALGFSLSNVYGFWTARKQYYARQSEVADPLTEQQKEFKAEVANAVFGSAMNAMGGLDSK